MFNKKLGFGLMRLPQLDANDAGKIDIEQLKQMVDMYLERGFTHFDTAWMYNAFQSESAIKEALVERYPREKYTLSTKLHAGFVNNKDDRDRIFNEQLRKTGAGYFDYYLLHDMGEGAYEKYVEMDCFNWITEKKNSGLVKHIGFSCHDTPEFLDKALTEHPEFEFVLLQINYLDWDSAGIRAHECYDVCVRHGKPVWVMEPVKGGTLANVPENVEQMFKAAHSDWSVPSWAIRFCATQPGIALVLSGMSNLAQLEDNTSYMADFAPLSNEDLAIVGKAVDAINETIAIPCTGCAYCVDGCPMNIAIPKYFSLYNADKQDCEEKGWKSQGEYYDRLTRVFGKAGDCVGCGQCEEICPQHLPIVEHLKEVAAHFGK